MSRARRARRDRGTRSARWHRHAAALAVLAIALAGAGRAYAEDAASSGAAAGAAGGDAAWRVYRDPTTGRMQAPPAGAAVGAGSPSGTATAQSTAPLTERPSDVPGGGVLVDLHGRFDSAAVAHRAPSGAATVDCVQSSDGGAVRGPAPAR